MSEETEIKNDSPLAGAVTQIPSTNVSDGLDAESVEHQTGRFTHHETGDAEL